MKKSIEEIECEIVESCAARRAEGWEIVTGTFGDHTRKLCCPIAATDVSCFERDGAPFFGEKLGLEASEVVAFYRGFDNKPQSRSAGECQDEGELYALGQRLRGALL